MSTIEILGEDTFVWEYMVGRFKTPLLLNVPRDRHAEKIIARASKIEYILERGVANSKKIKFLLFGNDYDKNRITDTFMEMEPSFTSETLSTFLKERPNLRKKICEPVLTEQNGLDPKRGTINTIHLNLYHLKAKGQTDSDRIPNTIYCDLTESIEALEITLADELCELKINSKDLSPIPIPQKFRSLSLIPFPFRKSSYAVETKISKSAERKLLLPMFVDPNCYTYREYHFSPLDDSSAIFNRNNLLSDAHNDEIVILTDSPEIAYQNYLLNKNSPEILWLSWHGEDRTAPNVDWTGLAGRTVYYLLVEHSGFSRSDVCKTAQTVMRSVERVGVTNLRFISLLPESPVPGFKIGPPNISPIILSTEEFVAFAEGRFRHRPPVQPDIGLIKPIPVAPARPLLTPLLYERTATLVYGAPYTGKTWLALKIGDSLSMGKSTWEDWRAPACSHVLYVHGDRQDSPLIDRFPSLARTQLSGNMGIPQQSMTSSHMYDENKHFRAIAIDGRKADFANFAWNSKFKELLTEQMPPSLVILDGFHSLGEIVRHGDRSQPFHWLIRALREVNCALMVVLSDSAMDPRSLALMKSRLPWDCILKVSKRQTKDVAMLGMAIRIEKGFKLPKTQARVINLEFCPGGAQTGWTVVRKSNMSRPQQQFRVLKLAKAGKKDKEIADLIGISLSMVKKHMRELRQKYSDSELRRHQTRPRHSFSNILV